MKKFLNLAVLFVLAVALISCRDKDHHPHDTHEHEEISKVVMKVTNLATKHEQSITYINGAASGALNLKSGDAYHVELDFQSKHNDHYHSVNDEIIKERDEHFIVFNFAGINAALWREAKGDVRFDGNIVGLKTEWEIGQNISSNAKVQIKLMHQPTSVNQNHPSMDYQYGAVTGGDADVDMTINIQ